MELPVANLEDVLQGKIWAALDPGRRGSKRQKDLADIARILEKYPEYHALVPQKIRSRLIDGDQRVGEATSYKLSASSFFIEQRSKNEY